MNIQKIKKEMNELHKKLTTLKEEQCGPFTVRISKNDIYPLDDTKQDVSRDTATGSPESGYKGIVFDVIKPQAFTKPIEFTLFSFSRPDLFAQIYRIQHEGQYNDITIKKDLTQIGIVNPTKPFVWHTILNTNSVQSSSTFTDNQFALSASYTAFIDSTTIALDENKNVYVDDTFALKFKYPFGLRWEGGSCEVNIPEIKFKFAQ